MNWIERDIHEDGDDHDIGLNLTLELKCPSQNSPQPKPSLNDIAFQSSSASKDNGFQGAVMNNMLAANIVTEPPEVSSSPGITISSGNGKRSNRDESGLEPQSNSSEGGGDNDSSAKKKLRLTKEQAAILEETFRHQCTLSQSQKIVLARQLSLQTRQVEVWFQNRRARTKFKKTEVDCAYLRRRCEDLAEENRRLQKEVAELRTLKFLANAKQPTTLTMCPQCERLGKVPVSSPIAPEQKTTTLNWLVNRL